MNKYITPDLNYERFFEGYNPPEKLKQMAISIMKRFIITGICDGMYICNVIAYENGLGNGENLFNDNPVKISNPCTAGRLMHAYSCNIAPEDRGDLEEILRTGSLDDIRMRAGILRHRKALKQEKRKCDEYRKDYITRCINYCDALLASAP